MLAYVFWHWPAPHIEKTLYQKRLIDFHEALRTQRPGGFHYSQALQLERAPWVGRSEDTYEDWYLVENFAALEALNEAAVSGLCGPPHQLVAQDAAGGAGGVYRLWAGEPGLTTARLARWFAKPAGMSYEQLNELLQSESKGGTGSAWQRQMVLGPTPEFCWHSPQDHRLPEIFEHAIPVNISHIYP